MVRLYGIKAAIGSSRVRNFIRMERTRCEPLLELFVTRCAGSFIEEKQNTLAWHYRNTDPGLGFMRSRELLQ